MDQPTPFLSGTPTASPAPYVAKKSSALLPVIIGIVLAALVVALVGYFLVVLPAKTVADNLNEQVGFLGQEKIVLQTDLNACKDQNTTLGNSLQQKNQEATLASESDYAGWNTYTSVVDNISFRYPTNWDAVTDAEIAGQGSVPSTTEDNISFVNGVSGNRIHVSFVRKQAADNGSLFSAIKLKDYPSVVATKINLGGTIITDKVVSSYNKKIKMIVYGYSHKDDGTNNQGIIAVGDYYFNIWAEGNTSLAKEDDKDISFDDQVIMEKILNSVKFNVTASTSVAAEPVK
ncbi:MAG: hypothetical protein WC310_01300 [Patescibacteria group bacterium]|jgi:hypothetical protein